MPIISGGAALFTSTTATLTNAQIKALPTTPVQIVPAPGAGRVLVPIFCWMHLTWVADYTNIDATAVFGLEWPGTAACSVAPLRETAIAQVSSLLADSASHPAWLPQWSEAVAAQGSVSGVGQLADDPGPTNAALQLFTTNATNFTGGNVGNSLKVAVYYATFTN